MRINEGKRRCREDKGERKEKETWKGTIIVMVSHDHPFLSPTLVAEGKREGEGREIRKGTKM